VDHRLCSSKGRSNPNHWARWVFTRANPIDKVRDATCLSPNCLKDKWSSMQVRPEAKNSRTRIPLISLTRALTTGPNIYLEVGPISSCAPFSFLATDYQSSGSSTRESISTRSYNLPIRSVANFWLYAGSIIAQRKFCAPVAIQILEEFLRFHLRLVSYYL